MDCLSVELFCIINHNGPELNFENFSCELRRFRGSLGAHDPPVRQKKRSGRRMPAKVASSKEGPDANPQSINFPRVLEFTTVAHNYAATTGRAKQVPYAIAGEHGVILDTELINGGIS